MSWRGVVATCVRGFKSWIDAGRCVRKGETSIRIFAPRPWQRETAVDEADMLQIEQGVSFAAVPVFDVSQTDPIPGHPHPWQPPVHHAASGDESLAWTIWEAMLAHVGALRACCKTSAAQDNRAVTDASR
jgi:antirestriction protein ArdC